MSLFVLFGQSQRDTPDKPEYDKEEEKTTRREKMKKLAILSPLVILMASTSLAQDSCIVRPSCADMGYTKTESQCEGKDSIKCPFDLTALFCHENESSEIEPDPEPIECDFGYLSQNGECLKIDNAIAFVLSVNANEGSIQS